MPYNRYAKLPAGGAALALPLLEEAVRRLELDTNDQTERVRICWTCRRRATTRGCRLSLQGEPARPLTNQPGAHFWNRVSPDGRFVLEASSVPNEPVHSEIVELATGQVRPARLLQGDEPVGWDQNGAHAFVVVRDGYSEVTIFRVDLASGNREVWKQIRPADPAGILSLRNFFVTPSGSAYTYSAGRARAAL